MEPHPKMDALIQNLRARTPPVPVTKPPKTGCYQKYSGATTATTTEYEVKAKDLPAAIRHHMAQGSIRNATLYTMTPSNQKDTIKKLAAQQNQHKAKWKQNKLNGKLSYSPNLRT